MRRWDIPGHWMVAIALLLTLGVVGGARGEIGWIFLGDGLFLVGVWVGWSDRL